MPETLTRHRIVDYLKKIISEETWQQAVRMADTGCVLECGVVGERVSGIVRDSEEITQSVVVTISAGRVTTAQCTCRTTQTGAASDKASGNSFCVHAGALLIQGGSAGLFEPRAGFAPTESLYRVNTNSPDDLGQAIRAAKEIRDKGEQLKLYQPHVSVSLAVLGDRLGIHLECDGQPQEPALFENLRPLSARALDNILLHTLDESGTWDAEHKMWIISSSESLEELFGLVQEYDDVRFHDSGKPVAFAKDLLSARIEVDWQPTSVQLQLWWEVPSKSGPSGKLVPKDHDLLGTGPYWTLVQGSVFRLSPEAAVLAAMFPYSSRITVPRAQCGPLLEALQSINYDDSLVRINHPEFQPQTEVKNPKPVIYLTQTETNLEHFAQQGAVEIQARLEFEYPIQAESSNVIFLPNRNQELQFQSELGALGFTADSTRSRFSVSGDRALDILDPDASVFPEPWKVHGLDQIRKQVRFADLTLAVSVSSHEEKDPEPGAPIDWFDCQITLTQNNANIPLSSLFKSSAREQSKWIRLDSGAYARIPGGGLTELKTALGLVDPSFRLSNAIKTRVSLAQAVGLSRLGTGDGQIKVNLDRRLRNFAEKLKNFDSIKLAKPTKSFTGKLRHYQQEGLSWLAFLSEFELDGILADEMGLGKTVQALALIDMFREKNLKAKRQSRPSLVVAPTSVITNWVHEARRFTPKLKTLLLHGPQRKRLFANIREYDLVVTSYALLRLDRYDLERQDFAYVILDEAQNIKNPQAATTVAAKSLRATRRLALSGTPTENRPMELWSIMDFLMPGYLGSKEFFSTYIEKPILEQVDAQRVNEMLVNRTRPFLLRRTKAAVEKDLPPKIESQLFVTMTDSQKELYAQILEEVRPKVFAAIDKKGVRGASVSILAALLRLRQVCNHPNSIEALKHLTDLDSGKFIALQDLVTEALESGRKILLFSQFREMLAIIRRWLEQQKVSYLYLDGLTKNRQDLVDRFNADESVRLFLISLKAGGTGLNLAGADTVIIYDPWWNPAVEHQAVDRAHRIGQRKAVNVYRLVTEGSIEEKIMQLKTKKSRIVDALINEKGLSTINLSKADLEALFEPLR